MRARLLIGFLVALAAAAALLFGGVFGGPERAAPQAASPPTLAAESFLHGLPSGNTADEVSQLEAVVAANRRDTDSLTLLGLAYQQRARETADPTYYGRSETALRRALALRPDDFLPTVGLASLAASRHRFREAFVLAARARRLRPDDPNAYGILGDALVELGRYRKAFAAFDRMAALKPSLAAYTRVSYGAELLGHTERAIQVMKLAADAGSATPENAAWTLVQLGNLYSDAGRFAQAERAYRAALLRLPGYVHGEAGLARVAAARGDERLAARLYRDAIARVPLPQYVIALGDVLRAAGRDAEARKTYALVGAIERLFAANGVRTELETALFDLDHGRDVADALARAGEAFRAAPSINSEDVFAWALYRDGRCSQAELHSRHALRLGTKDALKFFHRGMIERCLGDVGAARRFLRGALALNPHFSLLYAPVARRLLR